jgi:CHAD domain-containing protein
MGMSYKLSFEAELEESIRRVAREQLEAAAAELENGDGGDATAAVHGARKRLKKTRALVRLARPSLPESTYRSTNRALRDRGRALSDARDADVLVATVETLADRFAGRLPQTTFKAVRDALAERADQQRRASSDGLGVHADALRTLAGDADRLPVRSATPKKLARAMASAYADGRTAFGRADREPTGEHLHEWRKRVKDLWYEQKLVEEAWAGVLKAHAGEAKILSQVLGDDHDLAMLADALASDSGITTGVAADGDALRKLIEHRREELLADARSLGRRVYAETPKAYQRRVRRYLKSAVAESASRAPAAMTA